MNKEQAAKHLGVSPKTVERYASAGNLKPKKERTPNGQMQTVFDDAEVERLRVKLLEPPDTKTQGAPGEDSQAETGQEPTYKKGATSKALSVPERPISPLSKPLDIGALQTILQAIVASGAPDGATAHKHATVPIERKVYLTIQEAGAYSGLGVTKIKKAINTNKLKFYVGANGAHVLLREDVEKFRL